MESKKNTKGRLKREPRKPKRETQRVKAGTVEIDGVMMPCEYVCNEVGQYYVLMLADVEFADDSYGSVWMRSLLEAARVRFAQIDPSRKVSILVPGMKERQGANGFAFRQTLKREITASPARKESSAIAC